MPPDNRIRKTYPFRFGRESSPTILSDRNGLSHTEEPSMTASNRSFSSLAGSKNARLCSWLVLLFFFACSGRAGAQTSYYVMVFGSERDGPSPNYSHTWATFVKATPK